MQHNGQPADTQLENLNIEFPASLPVSARRADLERAMLEHQVIIVAGATGSGKTTQLPKMALEIGRRNIVHTQPRRIAARTIAERIAEELHVPLGSTVGYQVRFTDQSSADTRLKIVTDGVLLNEIHRDRNLRKYDTIIIDEAHERSLNIDFLLGYLKRLLPSRPDLKLIITSATIDPESFSTFFDGAPIIEVSGRTYPVETRYRPLIPESEDGAADAPPKKTEARSVGDAVVDAARELSHEALGDVLVFLSGEAEIRDVTESVEGAARRGTLANTEVLPLYGRLSAAEQHRVFDTKRPPGILRRIVLSTNVAETSLTVPGIRYVIDAGQARISRYSTRAKVQRLPIEAISQASAQQRAGRAGRTSPGIAIRLYSEDDYMSRAEYTEPEILRTNLAAVLLQMLSLGITKVDEFPFLTPPDPKGVKDGMQLLQELGAVRNDRLTKTGRKLAALPIEPRFARMIVDAARLGVLDEVTIIVAGMSIQDPRERPSDKQAQADEAHRRFADPTSDFLSMLLLWRYLEEQRAALSGNAFRRMCQREYLHYLRVREWSDVVHQINGLTRSLRHGSGQGASRTKPTTPSIQHEFDEDAIHRAILAGLLSQLGAKDERQRKVNSADKRKRKPPAEYIGSRNIKFRLHPSSALAKQPPDLVMTAELVETSRLFARTNAQIDPRWAEAAAPELVKRQRSEPHWDPKHGSAVGYERVTLFGVPLVERRRVQWANVDLAEARAMFIQHAFVDEEWEFPPAFERENRRLRHRLAQLEERSRRRDILDSTDVVFNFYNERVPQDVATCPSFERWWKGERAAHPDLFSLDEDVLLSDDAPQVDESEFPREWHTGDQRLQLRYRFDPGAEDDGVTIRVPLPLLPRMEAASFDGLVPGLRLELVTALIRSLPKPIRKHVVPAGDWAKKFLVAIEPVLAGSSAEEAPSMLDALAHEIRGVAGMPVSAHDFDLGKLPPHLRPTYQVLGDHGQALGSGKDLRVLQDEFAEAAERSVSTLVMDAAAMGAEGTGAEGKDAGHVRPKRGAKPRPQAHAAERTEQVALTEQSRITSWTVDTLPEHVDIRHGRGVVRAYPALVDERREHSGTAVALRILTTEDEALREHRYGVRRLLVVGTPSPTSYIEQHLTANERLLLVTTPHAGGLKGLLPDILDALADQALAEGARGADPEAGAAHVRSARAFGDLTERFNTGLVEQIYAVVSTVVKILDARRSVLRAIDRVRSLQLLSVLTELKQQIDGLVFDGFVAWTGLDQLSRLPVYLRAAEERLRKLTDDPGKVRAASIEVARASALFAGHGGEIPLPDAAAPELVAARWMLEELRVQAFAQQLGTRGTVSYERLARLLKAIE